MSASRNRRRLDARLALAALLFVSSVAACSSEQMYNSAHGWRQNQCTKIVDKAEYDRCMAQADAPYGSYKQQQEPKQ